MESMLQRNNTTNLVDNRELDKEELGYKRVEIPSDVCPHACSPKTLSTKKQDTGDKQMKLYSINLHWVNQIEVRVQLEAQQIITK